MRKAALIAGSYAVVGCAWIVVSDLGLLGVATPDAGLLYSVGKGVGFVVVTAAILFGALLALYGRQSELNRSLADSAMATETERLRRESAARLLAAVADSTGDMVWVFDEEARILSSNRAAGAALGSEPEAGPLDLETAGWPEEHRAEVRRVVEAAVASGITSRGRARYAFPTGARVFNYTVQPISGRAGGRPHALLVAQDITAVLAAEEARERIKHTLEAVVASLAAISRARDRQTLAVEVTRALHQEAGFVVAWIGVAMDGDELPITPIAAAGATLETVRRVVAATANASLPFCPPLVALRSGRMSLASDLVADPRFEEVHADLEALGIQAAIAFPLSFSGKTFATLNLYATSAAAFSEEAIQPLETLAEQLAYAFSSLDSLVRYEESETGRLEALSRIKGMLIETVGALAGVVEIRDPYTAGHQRRVAALAEAIGHEKGWGEDRMEGLRLGALIHDIGKIAVPTELLVTPGRLEPEAFALIQTHAARGGEILTGLVFDWPIYEMVTQHHERLDGSGYPQGLRDNEIAPEAKVIAVADVAEAMLSNRPYRASRALDDVVRELTRGRGTLYERESVDICLRLLGEHGMAVFSNDGALLPRPVARA